MTHYVSPQLDELNFVAEEIIAGDEVGTVNLYHDGSSARWAD